MPLTYGSLQPSGSTPDGPTALPTPAGGVGAAPWPYFRRNASNPRPSPYPDLESALVAYLRATPSISGPLTLAFGGGGFGVAPFGSAQVKVYSESADPEAQAPYLVLSSYTETSPGITPDDAPIEVAVVVHGVSLDQVVALSTAVKAAIDVPAYNPQSLGRPPLAWQGGVETTVWRNASKPRKKQGVGRGGTYPYYEQIEYQFWVDMEAQ
jgi:hypothetical protein